MADPSHGWNEHEKLVLQQLSSLTSEMHSMREEMHAIRRDVVRIEERETKVNEIRDWKEKMTSVISPEQYKTHLVEHQENRDFSVKAVTIFTVVQFLFATAVVWMRIFK